MLFSVLYTVPGIPKYSTDFLVNVCSSARDSFTCFSVLFNTECMFNDLSEL